MKSLILTEDKKSILKKKIKKFINNKKIIIIKYATNNVGIFYNKMLYSCFILYDKEYKQNEK